MLSIPPICLTDGNRVKHIRFAKHWRFGMDDEKDEDKQRAGQIGGAKRAEILPPERRAEIAQRAAEARWGKLSKATHKGNFEKEFGIDVECYVLDDANKTAVISQTGMAKALGLPSRASAFSKFLSTRAMADTVDTE